MCIIKIIKKKSCNEKINIGKKNPSNEKKSIKIMNYWDPNNEKGMHPRNMIIMS